MKSNLSITAAPLSVPPVGSATTCILLPAPKKNFAIKASSTNPPNPFLPHVKAAACAVIFSAATFWKLPAPALAQLPIPSESLICSAEYSLPLKSSSLVSRMLTEIERFEEALVDFEEVLSRNPLVVDRSGQREMKFLEEMRFLLKEMEEEMRSYDLLLKEMEEAMRSYELMATEDPLDLRPYYRKALMRNQREADQLFANYKNLHAKQHGSRNFRKRD